MLRREQLNLPCDCCGEVTRCPLQDHAGGFLVEKHSDLPFVGLLDVEMGRAVITGPEPAFASREGEGLDLPQWLSFWREWILRVSALFANAAVAAMNYKLGLLALGDPLRSRDRPLLRSVHLGGSTAAGCSYGPSIIAGHNVLASSLAHAAPFARVQPDTYR